MIFSERWLLCDDRLSPLRCRYYAVMVTMFFTVSVVNNYALNLSIAMPLHMVFRSVSTAGPREQCLGCESRSHRCGSRG